MSAFLSTTVTCPHCQTHQPRPICQSLNLDYLPDGLEDIAADRFELEPCIACDTHFRIEHPMLLSSPARRLWIVMHPLADRPRFAALERAVEDIFTDAINTAPPVLRALLRAVRPRLVFGHHMLAEAARATGARIEPVVLECAKLLAVRREIRQLMRPMPFELCFERFDDDGRLMMALHDIATGARHDAIELPPDALSEAREALPTFEALYPALFARPYVSASRCLYASTL